jgi:hypothetical protein
MAKNKTFALDLLFSNYRQKYVVFDVTKGSSSRNKPKKSNRIKLSSFINYPGRGVYPNKSAVLW